MEFYWADTVMVNGSSTRPIDKESRMRMLNASGDPVLP
jgi:hypothetical protein